MEKLNILWLNDNPDTAHLMVLMYAINAKKKGFWDEIEVIIWGASTKLVATDKSIQEKIKSAQEIGVRFRACVVCARELGVDDKIASLDINLEYMGEPLTQILKNDEKLLTV